MKSKVNQYHSLGGFLEVTFIHTKVNIDPEDDRVNWVTTCIARDPRTITTRSYTVVKNPHDPLDLDVAEQQAFKGCVEQAFKDADPWKLAELNMNYKDYSSYWRKQLWQAKNDPDLHKSMLDVLHWVNVFKKDGMYVR